MADTNLFTFRSLLHADKHPDHLTRNHPLKSCQNCPQREPLYFFLLNAHHTHIVRSCSLFSLSLFHFLAIHLSRNGLLPMIWKKFFFHQSGIILSLTCHGHSLDSLLQNEKMRTGGGEGRWPLPLYSLKKPPYNWWWWIFAARQPLFSEERGQISEKEFNIEEAC